MASLAITRPVEKINIMKTAAVSLPPVKGKEEICFMQWNRKSPTEVSVFRQLNPEVPVILFADTDLDYLDALNEGNENIIALGDHCVEVIAGYIHCCLMRVKAEFLLKENKSRYHHLTKAINNIVWDWQSHQDTALWMGSGLQTIMGYEGDELLVKNTFWEDNIHPEDRERVVQRLTGLITLDNAETWQDEYRFKNFLGEYRHIYDKGFMIYKNGKLERIIGSMEDITHVKEAEAAATVSEVNYKKLFNYIPLACFIWDMNNYNILEVNNMAIQEYGYTYDEFLSKTVLDLRPEEEWEYFKDVIKNLKENNILKHEQVWIHQDRKANRMLMQVSTFQINLQGKHVMLALSQNITEKTALQEKLLKENSIKKQQIAEAVVDTQEQERTRIACELHDNVNQLLGASRLYIEAAKKDINNQEDLLSQASDYIMNAIEEIRVLSRSLNTPLIQETGLKEAVANLSSDLSLINSIHIHTSLERLDESRIDVNFQVTIYRILQEQLTNIFKHADADQIIVRLETKDEVLELYIRDNGKGFVTGTKTQGIGIMNIYSRAALYNGKVFLESSPGEGCVLNIVFPLQNIEKNQALET